MMHASLAETVVPGHSKRTDFPLMPTTTALLIIDIQEYLSKPSTPQEGEQYLHHTALPRVVSNLQKLASLVREKRDMQAQGCEVIFTFLEAKTKDRRDVSLDYKLSGPKLASLPNSATCPATFLPGLTPRTKDGKGDILLPKTSCSVFVSTNLHYMLKNLHVEQLIITGQLTDQCIESAVRDAADLGYFVTVVEDACAATSEASHQKGLHGMSGFCRMLSTAQVMEELINPSAALVGRTIPKERYVPPKAEDEKVRNFDLSESVVSILPVTAPFLYTTTPNAVVHSMLTALKYAGVKFLRFMVLDAYNSIRCKVVPLDQCAADTTVAIAKVCFAGLPTFGDVVLPDTGLNAKGVLLVTPDYGTLRILPYADATAVVFGTAHEAPSRQVSTMCTRGLLSRVTATAKTKHGIHFNVGAELEFSLFAIASGKPVDNSLFASATTLNQQDAFITDCYVQLRGQSIDVEQLHSESGPGQLEMVIKYQPNPLFLVDQVVLARETIQAVARKHGCIANFLPKTFDDKAGNGLHLHLSFGLPNLPNAFPDPASPHSISRDGQSFVEGILQHLRGLLAVTLGSNNSFRRVGPGCWTGHQVAWDIEDKEVPLRVCMDLKTGSLTNVEFKLSDATSNLYLSLACILGSGLEGIVKQLKLRNSLSTSPVGDTIDVPRSFDDALSCLEDDSFLTNQIIGEDLSQAYLAIRRAEVVQSATKNLSEEVDAALRY